MDFCKVSSDLFRGHVMQIAYVLQMTVLTEGAYSWLAHNVCIQIPGFVLEKPGVSASFSASCLPGCSNCLSLCCNPESSGVGSPEFSLLLGTAPHPPPSSASTGRPHESGSGSPKDFTNAWPVPSIAQLGGLRAEEDGPSSSTAPGCPWAQGPLGLGPGVCTRALHDGSRLATAVVHSRTSLCTSLPSLGLVKVLGGNPLSRKS